MKSNFGIFAALLLLAACETNPQDKAAIKAQAKEDVHTLQDKAGHSGMRVANNVRDSIKKTSMKMREWWLTPLPSTEPLRVPPSYCYQVMQDVNCYRQPLPGATHRLVGFQGDMAPEPPLAQTEPLPVAYIGKDNSATPAARVASARPVFVAIPTPVKEDKSDSVDAATQVGSEPLPDPMLSPQL